MLGTPDEQIPDEAVCPHGDPFTEIPEGTAHPLLDDPCFQRGGELRLEENENAQRRPKERSSAGYDRRPLENSLLGGTLRMLHEVGEGEHASKYEQQEKPLV